LIFFLPDGLRPWQEQYVLQVIEFIAAVYLRPTLTVTNTIRLLGLSPVLRKRVDSLSKGFCRRLMLALALLTPHPLLLMDEPFDGFDLRQTREMMNMLREVALSRRTLLMAIHQLIDAQRVCDRFVLLAGGRVRGSGTLDELRRRIGQPSAGLEDIFLALT
jgi:ABC-2 type transport system ATP-binding protein